MTLSSIEKAQTEPTVIVVEESTEIRVRVGSGARASIVCICRGAPLPIHVMQSGEVAAGATLHWINITLGDGITQSLESTCSGEGGVSTVDWIFRASDHEKQTLSAKNIFSGARGEGDYDERSRRGKSA